MSQNFKACIMNFHSLVKIKDGITIFEVDYEYTESLTRDIVMASILVELLPLSEDYPNIHVPVMLYDDVVSLGLESFILHTNFESGDDSLSEDDDLIPNFTESFNIFFDSVFIAYRNSIREVIERWKRDMKELQNISI